jgi:hypothetical protein
MHSKAHTAPIVPLVLHRTRVHKCAMKKFGINGQMRNKLFLIIIYRFSLVKATMTAVRVLCAFVNCAMVLTKRLMFFFFQLPNAEQRP